MYSIKVREYLRKHVLGLLAIFIALSGTAIAAGGAPSANKSVVTNAKFKKLKHRVAALEKRAAPAIPTSLPPSGPAGGSLAGSYPNPSLAANSVGAGQIADGAVGASEVAADALTGANIDESTLAIVPNADLLDGKDSTAFLSNVASGTTGSVDPPSVAANSCFTGDIAISGVVQGDFAVVGTPQTLDPGLSVTPLISNATNEVRLRFCNVTNSAIDEGIETFRLFVLRP